MYNKTSAPVCDDALCEKLRALTAQHKKIQNFSLLIPFCAIVFCFFGAVLSLLRKEWLVYLFIIAIIAALLVSSMSKQKVVKHKKLIRETLTCDALRSAFELIEYSPETHIDRQFIIDGRLRFEWNICEGNDFFQARYKGVEFMFSDVQLIHYKKGESGYNIKRFFGQWLVVKLAQTIEPPVIITERIIANPGWFFNKSKSCIETENPAFNEKFIIECNDPYMASYVLTPHCMEYIMSADYVAKGKTHMCFTGNCVHVAIDTAMNFFEWRTNSDDIQMLRRKIQGQVKYITNIIDELLLNKELFKPD